MMKNEASSFMSTGEGLKKIAVFTQYYIPGYRGGGPIRSVENLVDRLGGKFDFYIFTLDRDLGDDAPYKNVDLNGWNVVGRARVLYLDPRKLVMLRVLHELRRQSFDVIYLNGLFNRVFSIPFLFLSGVFSVRRIILAPRGELSVGALSQGARKKGVFLKIGRALGLFNKIRWQASTELEAKEILSCTASDASQIWVARNLLPLPKTSLLENNEVEASAVEGASCPPLRICFLSRISPKKNLNFAIDVLRCVEIPVCFNIYGPKEDAVYWELCKELISSLPSNIEVNYRGEVEHANVRREISKHEVFFFPTKGENFGHVYLESWSAGVPVLTSDQTPWRNLAKENLGWDFALDEPLKFVNAITSYSRKKSFEKNEFRLACLRFAEKSATDEDAVSAHEKMFSAVAQTGRVTSF